MDASKSKRKTSIYCPNCGHMEVKARVCDIEVKCRRCNYQFEAVIGPYGDMVRDRGERTYGEPNVPDANQAGRFKLNNPIKPDS
jgi:hypothetical protein